MDGGQWLRAACASVPLGKSQWLWQEVVAYSGAPRVPKRATGRAHHAGRSVADAARGPDPNLGLQRPVSRPDGSHAQWTGCAVRLPQRPSRSDCGPWPWPARARGGRWWTPAGDRSGGDLVRRFCPSGSRLARPGTTRTHTGAPASRSTTAWPAFSSSTMTTAMLSRCPPPTASTIFLWSFRIALWIGGGTSSIPWKMSTRKTGSWARRSSSMGFRSSARGSRRIGQAQTAQRIEWAVLSISIR